MWWNKSESLLYVASKSSYNHPAQKKNTFQGSKHQTRSCRRSGWMPWWLNCSEKSSSSSAPNSKMILIHKSVSQIASSPERSQGPLSPFSSPLPRFPYPQELILCFLLSHTAWHKNGWMIFLHTPLYHMIDVTVSLFQFSIQTPLRCRCHGKKKTSDTLRFGVNQQGGEI